MVSAKARPVSGLADRQAPSRTRPYKPKLGLDYVGQPYLGGGTGRYGAYFGGGIAMSFSDMLGNHSLADHDPGRQHLGLHRHRRHQSATSTASHRFNWGLQIEQIPYVIGGLVDGHPTSQNGQQVYVEQIADPAQIDRGVTVQAFYPFDSSLRGGGLGRLPAASASTRGSQTTGLRPSITGQQVLERTRRRSATRRSTSGETDAAIVRDTSVFGATSPIMGQRFRFDVSPTFGTLNYTGALADFRQYLMPVRPGHDRGPRRPLRPLRLRRRGPAPVPGLPGRSQPRARLRHRTPSARPSAALQPDGELPSVRPAARQPDAGHQRRGAGAAARPSSAARISTGPIPVEIGAFFDAGVAWDSTTKPQDLRRHARLLTQRRRRRARQRPRLRGARDRLGEGARPPGQEPLFQFNLLAGFEAATS